MYVSSGQVMESVVLNYATSALRCSNHQGRSPASACVAAQALSADDTLMTMRLTNAPHNFKLTCHNWLLAYKRNHSDGSDTKKVMVHIMSTHTSAAQPSSLTAFVTTDAQDPVPPQPTDRQHPTHVC
jgi:hypothetical protein